MKYIQSVTEIIIFIYNNSVFIFRIMNIVILESLLSCVGFQNQVHPIHLHTHTEHHI